MTIRETTQELYDHSCANIICLKEFYSIDRPIPLPDLAVRYDPKDNREWDSTDPNLTKEEMKHIYDEILKGTTTAFYDSEKQVIGLDYKAHEKQPLDKKNKMTAIEKSLLHEDTHTLFPDRQGTVCLTLGDIVDMRALSYNKQLAKKIIRLGITYDTDLHANISEFFMPLSYAFKNYDYHDANWERDVNEYPEEIGRFRRAAPDDLISIVEHIAQIAGEIAMDNYEGDAVAFLKDHKGIAELPLSEVWENICIPILMGK